MTTWDATIGGEVTQLAVNFSSSGDNTLINGLLGTQIKILQFFIVWAGATNLTYKSNQTVIAGSMNFSANGAQVQDYFQLPLTCNPGDPFIVNSSSAVQIGGTIWYSQI